MRINIACGLLLLVFAAVDAGCIRETPQLATLPIQLDSTLGDDLQLEGLSVQAKPDRRAWVVTLHLHVVRRRDPRPELWVHAYPMGSPEYLTLDPTGHFVAADVGTVVLDGFRLNRPGAFNLYAGVKAADGSLGPAVGLGWVGVGDPDTKAYHDAYRFLQEENDARAAAMLEQTRRDFPHAILP